MPLRSGRPGSSRIDLLLLVEEPEGTTKEECLAASIAVARLLCCDVSPARAGLTSFAFASTYSTALLQVPLTDDWRVALGGLERSLAVPTSLKACLRAAALALSGKAFSGQIVEVVLLLASPKERLPDDSLYALYSLAHRANVRRGLMRARCVRNTGAKEPKPTKGTAPTPSPRREAHAGNAPRLMRRLPMPLQVLSRATCPQRLRPCHAGAA